MDQSRLSRRTLFAGVAAGVASAALSQRAVHAGETDPVKDSAATLRWGLIGTGTRGAGTHVPVMKAAPESRIVAMCDVAEDRLQTAVTRHGQKVATYSDWQKLLANPDVNAVIIATPNLLHREMFLAALQAGKHVLCEKPAGVSFADAAEMKTAADAVKTVVMFGMQYRNRPQQKKIAELIGQGRIGKPRYMLQNVSRGDWNQSANVWQYSDPKVNGGKTGNWRLSHAATGGTLNEFDCHYFDLLHGLAGALPESISCQGGISVYKDGRDTWDHATVTLGYPGGMTAVHTLCLFGPSRNVLCVFGDEGSIETADNMLIVNTRGGGRKGARRQEVAVEDPPRRSNDDSTLALYDDFLACVKTGKKPDAGIDRAIASSRTCWLSEQSAQRSAPVRWAES